MRSETEREDEIGQDTATTSTNLSNPTNQRKFELKIKLFIFIVNFLIYYNVPLDTSNILYRQYEFDQVSIICELNTFRIHPNPVPARTLADPNSTRTRFTFSQISAQDLLRDQPPHYDEIVLDLQSSSRRSVDSLQSPPRFNDADEHHPPPKFETLFS